MMRRIDAYLSRKAQAVGGAFAAAMVYCNDDGPVEVWTLERHGAPPIGLGSNFGAACRAIQALKAAKKAAGDA